jgi:radical SAM-linked protein
LRILFGKYGALKYIGHLDLTRTFERVLRRAQIGLAYSQGFNARPRMQLAAPLPLGVTSQCEILDIWLEQPLPLEGLTERLMAVSPVGLPIYHIEEVPVRSPALQTLLESGVYLITLQSADDAMLRQQVETLLSQPTLIRTRRDKRYDLRPLIVALSVDDQGRLQAELTLSEQGTGRPDELLGALGLDSTTALIHRVQIKLRQYPRPETPPVANA